MPEQASEQLERDIKRGERWLIGIGIATLAMNAVIALIYWGQLREMRRATDAATQASQTAKDTLTEMRSGGGATDTHTLAQEAVTQAQQTTALVAAANKQAAQTEILARQAASQAAAAEGEAKASVQSVKIATQQLDSSQRPWMRVGISLVAASAQEPRPVGLDEHGNLYADIVVFGQNVGKSPALNVSVEARLIPSPPPFAAATVRAAIEAQQRSLCGDSFDMLGSGDTVFPEAPYPLFRHVSLTAQEVKSELASPTNKTLTFNGHNVIMPNSDAQTLLFFSQAPGWKSNPSVAIIGCLRYSADYSPTDRHTLFMYDLNGIDLRTPDAHTITVTQHFSWGNSAK